MVAAPFLLRGPDHRGQCNMSNHVTTSPPSLLTETLLSFSQAAGRLPSFRKSSKTGRPAPITPSCIFRWVVTGVKLADGSLLRLEAVRVGGRWLTSAEALERFAARQTPTHDDAPQPQVRTPGRRQRESERAAKALSARGI